MLCEEIMRKDVQMVAPDDSAQTAASKMRDENIGFLPVVDQSGAILGTVTDRDLATRLVAGGHDPAHTPVGTVMTRGVVSCHPSDDIRRAEELMRRNHKSRIVCIDSANRLAGIISLSDIVQYEEEKEAVQTVKEVAQREAHLH
ncbi:MAG: CBS domain-containing protein [Pseudomonadota bacterium]